MNVEQYQELIRDICKRIDDHDRTWERCIIENVASYNPQTGDVAERDLGRLDGIRTDRAYESDELLMALCKELKDALGDAG